jgi:acyl carrier protein
MTTLESTLLTSTPKQESLTSKIRARIAEHLGISVEHINDDANLNDDLGLDLLDVIELMMLLEDAFVDAGVTNETDQIEAVGDLIRHIERNQ